MKILFLTAHFGLIRNFEAGLRELASRGHTIVLVAQRQESLGGDRLVRQMATEYPGVTFGWAPPLKLGEWFALGRALRLCLDYLRYLHPRYANSPKLRHRAAEQAPPFMVRWCRMRGVRSRLGVGVLAAIFRLAQHATPIGSGIDRFIEEHRPDVFLVTPLLYFGSPQVDFVRSAMAHGIPTALCTGSWDHLTTKGLIHIIPDRVFVWNEPQKREAVELHGVPGWRVVVTGAHTYDHWFNWPARPLEAFCASVGLDSSRPYVLYLGSSPFIAPDEPKFVERWVARIQSHDTLQRLGILIRPHPQNVEGWDAIDFSQFENVRVWPPRGANPVDDAAKADYFDSIYHSLAVVGVNTSGLIEAGIIGRPVHTILVEEFADTQEGTLHFQHLVRVNGGLLHVARDLEENVAQLHRTLANGGADRKKSRRFVEVFIRPHGIDRKAAPIFADAVEALDVLPRIRRTTPLWHSVLRPVLYPFARLAADALAKEQALRSREKLAPRASRAPADDKVAQLRSVAEISLREGAGR